MQQERFEEFTGIISDISKNIQRIKTEETERFGLKGVHVLWVYQLYLHPHGLSSSELARKSGTDRSLISREISLLFEQDILMVKEEEGKRRYNQKLYLTEKGKQLAEEITRIVSMLQRELDADIPEEDLETFYRVIGLFQKRLAQFARNTGKKERKK